MVILTSSHKYRDASSLPYGIEDEKAPVIIGKGCWIGWGAMIKPGVTIGDGAIIAMGSVVVNDVNKGEIAGGNPAKVINKRPDAQNIEQMIAEEKYFLKEAGRITYMIS